MPIKLRPYQVEVGRAVLDSVLSRKGLTFTVEMARQGGKNELSAQLEVLLLTLFLTRGGNAVKAAPTFHPQADISLMRLRERLEQAGYGSFWALEKGYMVRLGRARQVFLSAAEASHVVGATAHLLLEVDEAQDVSKDKFYKEFRPMGAAGNVTAVLYGTPWDDSTLLEEMKQLNLELERQDGVRRHFSFDWQEVGKYNLDYLHYVEGERQRLGDTHPLFLTQYCLRPVQGGGGFLIPQQRAQLQGEHQRRHSPSEGRGSGLYVAGVDLAGEAEEALRDGVRLLGQDAALRALKPRQDSVAVTIGELAFPEELGGEARVDIVEHGWWTGTPHPALYSRLADLLGNVWRCRRVVVDATGVGQGVSSFLSKALGHVVAPFTFTQASKSRLGFQLLAAVNSGRVKMYRDDGSPEQHQFWHEMEMAKSHYRPSQTMSFYVDSAQGHDDFLMSLALLVEAANYRPRSARGRSAEVGS
ncbi:MAG: hypothetical protein HY676_05575 [Chloroflexi bacterium]|nr:hypothetical protein [Chloroflexota bacterium]